MSATKSLKALKAAIDVIPQRIEAINRAKAEVETAARALLDKVAAAANPKLADLDEVAVLRNRAAMAQELIGALEAEAERLAGEANAALQSICIPLDEAISAKIADAKERAEKVLAKAISDPRALQAAVMESDEVVARQRAYDRVSSQVRNQMTAPSYRLGVALEAIETYAPNL